MDLTTALTHTHTWSSGHTHTHTWSSGNTHTWSSGNTHTHTHTHTHLEQWAVNAAAPGGQLGVRCLAQGSQNQNLHMDRQCKKTTNNLHMHRQCKKKLHWSIYSAPDSAKKTTTIYIWTVHIYRLYRRQCAKYTYIYSVHIVYYKDTLNYQRHIIHRMGTSTLCTVSIHNVVYT